MKNLVRFLSLGLVLAGLPHAAMSGSVIIVANGASTGPVITASAGTNLSLGTQLRVGFFSNSANLTSAIGNWNGGTSANSVAEVDAARTALFNSVVSSLGSNFVDLGTNVSPFGNSSQTGTGVAANKFVINTSANLTINGTTSSFNVANGQIQNVQYSNPSVGTGKQLYIWTAFNNEIGIFTDTAWITPGSDLTNLTINLSAISNSASEILLGSYLDNASGNDFLRLGSTTVTVIPEPATFGYLAVAGLALLARRRSGQNNRSQK